MTETETKTEPPTPSAVAADDSRWSGPLIPGRKDYVSWLAEALDEHGLPQRTQIDCVAKILQFDGIHALYQETVDIQSAGGMLTVRDGRKKTMGGIFFTLARRELKKRIEAGELAPAVALAISQSKRFVSKLRAIHWLIMGMRAVSVARVARAAAPAAA